MDSNDYWACRLTKLGKVQFFNIKHYKMVYDGYIPTPHQFTELIALRLV